MFKHKHMPKLNIFCTVIIIVLFSCEKNNRVTIDVNFENLELQTDSFWIGQDTLTSALVDEDLPGARIFQSEFNSEGVIFPNIYVSWSDYNAYSWNGFGYSNKTENNHSDEDSHFCAYPGVGADNSSTYVIASPAGEYNSIIFNPSVDIASVSIANNTFTALSLKKGSIYSKKFGGEDGNDPDWFKLTITGIDEENRVKGKIDAYLADFRFENNSMDYISNTWTKIDLQDFGRVRWLQFNLSSSDTSETGMKTPALFCLDNITFYEN